MDPSDVSLVVMTHLPQRPRQREYQWPQATVLVDRVERRAAGRRAAGPYVHAHLATIERWREVDYAAAAPFESFRHTIDLFGDGLVRLVSSRGHSLGHQSVLLRLRDRYALICGDAAMSTPGSCESRWSTASSSLSGLRPLGRGGARSCARIPTRSRSRATTATCGPGWSPRTADGSRRQSPNAAYTSCAEDPAAAFDCGAASRRSASSASRAGAAIDGSTRSTA